MTRKDEFEARSNELVAQFGRELPNTSLYGPRHRKLLERMFAAVMVATEKEVLSRIEDQIKTNAFIRGNDQYKERNALNEMAEWCKQQKEAL